MSKGYKADPKTIGENMRRATKPNERTARYRDMIELYEFALMNARQNADKKLAGIFAEHVAEVRAALWQVCEEAILKRDGTALRLLATAIEEPDIADRARAMTLLAWSQLRSLLKREPTKVELRERSEKNLGRKLGDMEWHRIQKDIGADKLKSKLGRPRRDKKG
jgi:hypothetical protein